MRKRMLHTEQIRENAIQLYGVSGSVAQVSRELGIPWSTVKRWIAKPEKREEVMRIREKNRKQFAQRAGELVEKSLLLLEKRVSIAFEQEEELERLVQEILATDKKEMTREEKNQLVGKLRSLQVHKPSDILEMIDALLEKQAAAQGAAIENAAFQIDIRVVE